MATAYYYFLLTLSLLTFYGAAAYRFYRLNYAGVLLAVALTAITFIVLKKVNKVKESEGNIPEQRVDKWSFLVTYLAGRRASYWLLVTIDFFILLRAATADSIISPWQVVPWYFWLTFFASTILLIIIIFQNSAPHFIGWLPVIGYWLLVLSVAVIIYQVGFGFDPFVHQATEKLINTAGAVHPKPWYYLGQYALIVILHKLTFIPIVWLDKLLVPIFAALALPYALYQAAKSLTADERAARLTSLGALIFPFTAFIVTTPQNLANLFLLLLILTILSNASVMRYALCVMLALAALITHPIAGIPAVLFLFMTLPFCHCEEPRPCMQGRDDAAISSLTALKTGLLRLRLAMTWRTAYWLLVTIFSVISLPLAFYLNNKTNAVINAANDAAAEISWRLPQLFFSGTENFLLNFVYLYGFNIGIIILLFVTAGIIIALRVTRYALRDYLPYLLMSASLLLAYFITKTISFSYLIDYERSNFADRILIISAYFAAPFILLALAKFIELILRQERAVKYLFFCFLAFLLSCSLYFSYPRYDDYFNSRSFSTAQADIDAVRWINRDASNGNYIALANQQVSAAALREFGFKKYYQIPSPYQGDGEGGLLFYYPIPTGEKLYQYYLEMVDTKADKKTALAAADLVEADIVYFVINNYWFAFDKILAEAAISAEVVQNIDNGKIFIFKYRK